jgi:hypothetical protein
MPPSTAKSNPMGKPLIPNQWMRSEWDNQVKRMVTLYQMPNAHLNSQRRLNITTHLNETLSKDRTSMRLVFNTELIVDVSANDDELRAAFIQLVVQSARTIYGPAAMLAKSKPILKISESSRDGMVDIDMMTGLVTTDEIEE